MWWLALIMLLSESDLTLLLSGDDPEAHELAALAVQSDYYAFTPRTTRVEQQDEQAAFVEPTYAWDPLKKRYVYDTDGPIRFSICLGGNGSGKTLAASYKVARHVLELPPPRPRCPFWIIGDIYDTTCDVCWVEKLSKLIPESMIGSVDWYKRTRQWPYAVMLKHPDDPKTIGWVLEFKSYEQGLSAFKAKSIGGYWFNEEVPYPIVAEVQGRCREYDSPGWADFTPVEVKSPEWPDLYENPPPGWRFFHLNTECNTYLPEGWAEQYLAQVPEDMRETRRTGVFAILRGAVFKEFRKSIHVRKPFKIPRDWKRIRGIDFGFNNAFCCLWLAKDNDGRYWVYDEHYASHQLNDHHAKQILSRTWESESPFYGNTYSDHDAQQRAEFAKLGIHTTPALKDVRSGIDILASHMVIQGNDEPKLFIFENCTNLIREIMGYKWATGTDKRSPRDEPMKVNDHSVDALRYAIATDTQRGQGSRPEGRRVTVDGSKHGIYTRRRRA